MSSPKVGLSDAAFCRQAKALRCTVAQIKAVAEVESRGGGFLPDGRPKILFERHIFDRAIAIRLGFEKRREIRAAHPNICSPSPGGYGRAGNRQWQRFSLAFSIDPTAAMLACSWGRFQVMGFNWEDLGYDSVGDFVDQMKEAEDNHLDAFVRFVRVNGLSDELREGRWADFAKRYNGPAYKKNKYDTKMARAHARYRREGIDCNTILAFAAEQDEDRRRAEEAAREVAEQSDELIDEVTVPGPVEPANDEPTTDPPDTSEDDAPKESAPTESSTKLDQERPPEIPKAEPVSIEDWRGRCWKWFKWLSGGWTGTNASQTLALVGQSVRDPENTPYYLGAGVVILVLTTFLGVIGLAFIIGVLVWNRQEIKTYIRDWAANQVNPNTLNYDIKFKKK